MLGYPAPSHGGLHYQPQENILPAPGFNHGPPLDEHGGQVQQNMDPQNSYNPPPDYSLQNWSRTSVIQRVSVIQRNPDVDQMEELDAENEAAVETMKNYSTQAFMDIGEDDSFESTEYNSSWFDDSFGNDDTKTPTFGDVEPDEDSSSVTGHLTLKVAMLEGQLSKCESDKKYLEALLAVRDMDFARYITLERKQRKKVEELLDQMEMLEDKNFELQQKCGEPSVNVDDAEIIVSELISEVLSSISTVTDDGFTELNLNNKNTVEDALEEPLEEASLEEETHQTALDKINKDETSDDRFLITDEKMPDKCSPVAGPFKEQILSLKKIQATAGLCPAEQIKLTRLEEISRTEEYLNLVPHSKSSLASTSNFKRKPQKLKCQQQISKRPKRKASDDAIVSVEKKAKMISELNVELTSEKKSPNVKKPASHPPPYLWDGQTMTAGMKYSEAEVKKILELKRTEKQLFMADPARLVIYRNPALMAALTTQDDPKLVFASWNLTTQSYEEVTGETLEATGEKFESNEEDSKNKIGRDQPNDLLKISNSKSFYQLINTMFNKIYQFSSEMPEFSNFDWLEADLNQIDFVVKLFLEWLQPLKKSCAMGDRTTTGTNKTYKTGLQNVFKFVLKRKDIELSRQSCSMSLSMMAYRGKQAAYANSGQLVPEGSRDRKALLDNDQDLRDQWLTKPLKDIKDPDDLTLTVAAIITDQACVRGVKVLEDISRSAFRTNLFDEEGKEYIEVKQAISRKRDQGYASKPFRPFNKKFTGDHEVKAIKLLLSKLPPPGCKYCKSSDDLKECLCNEWLLRSKPLESWHFSDQVWYARQTWSEWKISQINAKISKKANLSKKYTNSSARPTGITNLTRAGYTSAEISAVSEHVDMNTLEKYKKLTHLTQAADRHRAGLILAPSGRQFLRGKDNQFGLVGSNEESIYSVFQDAKLQTRSSAPQVKTTTTDSDKTVKKPNTKEVSSKATLDIDDTKKIVNQDATFKKPNPMKATLDVDDTKKQPKADFHIAPFKVGQKVFAKLRCFPYWPAAVTRAGYDHKKEKFIFTVMFPNNQSGVTDEDHIMKLTMENYEHLLGQKFKKSGYEVKSNFASDVLKLQ